MLGAKLSSPVKPSIVGLNLALRSVVLVVVVVGAHVPVPFTTTVADTGRDTIVLQLSIAIDTFNRNCNRDGMNNTNHRVGNNY